MYRKHIPLFLVIIFGVLSGMTLLHPGLPPTHDGETHVVRFFEFNKVLKEGIFYPRWAPDFNNGYGIPFFNFVYPLPNYVASFFHLFGVSFIDGLKLNMFFASIIGGIYMYYFSKIYFGDKGGVVSSVFYLFSPYRFVDIFVRGSVGEVWALAFFPAFLWAVTKLFFVREKKYVVFSSIFLSLIIFSHNILSYMFFPLAICYTLLLLFSQRKVKNLFLYFFLTFIFALGLSAIFWLPAISERQYTRGLQVYDIGKNFPEPFQLLFPYWGTGFSEGDLQNQPSYQVGVANLLVVVTSFVVFGIFVKKKNKLAVPFGFFFFSFFFVFFLMLKISSPIWHAIPYMNYFQFPWRLLSLEILCASFLAGGVALFLKAKTLSIFMIFFAVLLSISYTMPAYYLMRNDSYYLTKPNFIDGTNSPGNIFNTKWFTSLPKAKNTIVFKEGTGIIVTEEAKTNRYRFRIKTLQSAIVQLNIAYFPGWEIKVDGAKTQAFPTKDGIMQVPLSSGEHMVHIVFVDTISRIIGNALFFLTTLFLIVFLLQNRYPKIRT